MIILCSSFIEPKIKEQNVQKNTMITQKHTYHQFNPRLVGVSSETPGSSKTSMTWTHSQCNLGLDTRLVLQVASDCVSIIPLSVLSPVQYTLNNPFKSAMVITDLSHP